MTTKRDGERPTVKLQPREVAALLHEPQPAALETDAQTIELLPLTDPLHDAGDPGALMIELLPPRPDPLPDDGDPGTLESDTQTIEVVPLTFPGGALEAEARTIEALPLAARRRDTSDSNPSPRIARGSEPVPPTGHATTRMKPRRTRSKLRVDAITTGLPKKRP